MCLHTGMCVEMMHNVSSMSVCLCVFQNSPESSWLTELLWTFFVPCTVYHVRYKIFIVLRVSFSNSECFASVKHFLTSPSGGSADSAAVWNNVCFSFCFSFQFRPSWLPPVSRQDSESTQEFANKVQEVKSHQVSDASADSRKGVCVCVGGHWGRGGECESDSD